MADNRTIKSSLFNAKRADGKDHQPFYFVLLRPVLRSSPAEGGLLRRVKVASGLRNCFRLRMRYTGHVGGVGSLRSTRRPGTTTMAIHTFAHRCSAPRWPSQSLMANLPLAPGSKSFLSILIPAPAPARSSARLSGYGSAHLLLLRPHHRLRRDESENNRFFSCGWEAVWRK